MQSDLVVSGRLVAAKGTRVYGRVTEAKAGTGTGGAPVLAMELTDIQVGDYVYSLGTNAVRLTADGKNPTKKIVGGAVLGAGIGAAVGAAAGAVAGTAVAAGSSGNQVTAGAGSALEFQVARPLTVTVLVPASATAA